jgi:hypothetical protein
MRGHLSNGGAIAARGRFPEVRRHVAPVRRRGRRIACFGAIGAAATSVS